MKDQNNIYKIEKKYIKTEKPKASLNNTIFPLDVLVFYNGQDYVKYMVVAHGSGKMDVVDLQDGFYIEMNCLYGDTLIDKIEEEFDVEWVCKEE